MVPEYPSNSNKSKSEGQPPEQDKVAPVVTNPVGIKKKRNNKFLRMIFRQDFKDVKQGIVTDYLEPTVQNLAWAFIQAGIDGITNILCMMVYEDYRPLEKNRLPAERYSYNNYYSSSSPRPAPTMTSEINYDEFTYWTRGEAEAVLNELKNLIARCKWASVLDLYNLSKVSTSNYTLQDWGWENLDFAEIHQAYDEDRRLVYTISLPKAKMIPRR